MEKTVRILTIEEDPLAAGLIKGWLNREKVFPFVMDWCSSLAEGMAHLRQNGYDAVLVTLNLPDSPMENTINQVSAISALAPPIVLTADRDTGVTRRAFQQGAVDFLLKGHFDGTMLTRAIQIAMERHQHARENETEERMKDGLTGLYSRAFFLDFAEKKIDYARRNLSTVAVIFCDAIDISKSAESQDIPSDSQLLVSIGNVLKTNFRSSDLIARFGGSRFGVLALDTDFEGLRVVERRLQAMLGNLHLHAFFGLALYDPAQPRPLGALIENAEKMVEEEKQRDWRKRRSREVASRLSAEESGGRQEAGKAGPM